MVLVLAILLIAISAVNIFKSSSEKTPEITAKEEIKDCGSTLSEKAGNKDNLDRECFLKAYKACTSAKLYQEVVDPNNNHIKTTILIDGKEDNKCRVSIHVQDKSSYPENTINYCYSLGKTEFNDFSLKVSECDNKKETII